MQPSAQAFRPLMMLRSGDLQTMLSSAPFRHVLVRRRARALLAASQPLVIDAGHGVRLSGAFSPSPRAGLARGTAIVLHGWEGSIESSYVLETSARLFHDGWDVVRFNLRDHGGSHALNHGIFHSCLIDEVVGAVAEIARRHPARPLTLTGFSLGGNFVLRVGLRAPAAGIPLAAIAAVCPAIDPEHTLASMERGFIYHEYFLRKWRHSLKIKQKLFPDLDLLRPGDRRRNLRELTRVMTERQTDFGTLENYLNGYSVAGDRLANLSIPTRVLTARDDPVIPIADFAPLAKIAAIELDVAEHGGHCGFIRDWRLTSFLPGYLATWLGQFAPEEALEPAPAAA